MLLMRLFRGIEKLLCGLEKLYNILNDDRDGRKGKRQTEIENCFADPKIKQRESYADPNGIAPFTGNQFVKT